MNLSARQLRLHYEHVYGITPDRDEPPPGPAYVGELPDDDPWVRYERERATRRARMEADRERMRHRCETCPDCIHDGNKCCGCYDGACCRG